MILRLALRSLATRPVRTAVLACGFGFGIAVMAALLGVGDVILEQAHSPAIRGGGDVLITGAFGPVANARYLLSSVLGSPEFRTRVAAASPSRRSTLYLIAGSQPIPVAVRGGIPSLERAVGDSEVATAPAWTDTLADRAWSSPDPSQVLRAMDRFHPLPAAGGGAAMAGATIDPASWAEWLYFNARSADGRLRVYVTFLTGPPNTARARTALVRLQLDRDGRSENYSAAAAIDEQPLLQRAPDMDVAGNRVRLDGLRYCLTLALSRDRPVQGAVLPQIVGSLATPRGGRLTGEITLDATPGRSLPPATIAGARGWVSGYVVPVLSGAIGGTLTIDGLPLRLDGMTGYHDHNWGFWEGVRWQWGQAAHDDLSIVYGRIFPPPDVADPDRVPGFLGVLGSAGPIAFSTNVSIVEANGSDGAAPRRLTVRAQGDQLDIGMTFTTEESVRTGMALTRAANGATLDFLQLGGRYEVTGRAGTRDLRFTSRGSAETFRPRQ